MDFLTDQAYSFHSKALATDTFAVVDIKGEEGLSQCYRFEIRLAAGNADIDMDAVLRSPATFRIHRGRREDVVFHGILDGFEQQQAVGAYALYRAVLVPRLWRLNLTRHNQVFLNQTVQQMAEAVLKDGGLTSRDFDFRLQGQYSEIGYACQYGETHFAFLSRWLEREGIYYYFEQTDSGEKIVFTDTAIAHQPSPHGDELPYSPPSGLVDDHFNEIALGLICRHKAVPRSIRLKDYNYRKPSLEVFAAAVVDPKSSGEIYLYGEHFRSPEEGDRLAKIRAQELLCGKETFIGDSTAPFVSPGCTFTLNGHYRRSYNQKYLTVAVTHEGSQTGFLTAGLQQDLSENEKRTFYRNQFTAIPAGVQFRPPRTARQPKIAGTLNARIDAAGSGKYAELDAHGRYKVILPFDLSGRKDGKASAWLRMAQPYAGSDHGMHFPLHKNTEVLLTFVEGNPDRPVIAAAVPNPEAPSPVTSADQTMAKITTAGGNKVHIEDQEGNQRILLHTPTSGSFLRLGAPNDPDSGGEHEEKDLAGVKLVTADAFKLSAGAKNEVIIGEETSTVLGGHMKTVAPVKVDVTIGLETGLKIGGERVFTPYHRNLHVKRTNISAKTMLVDVTRTRMAEQANDFYEQKIEAGVEAFDLGEDCTQIVREGLKLGTIHTQVSEASTKLAETHTKMIQDHNKIVETENTVAQTVNTLGEAINTLAETVTVLAETDVAMAETQVSLADSYIITSAETIIL